MYLEVKRLDIFDYRVKKNEIKIFLYQDKYLCFGIIFNHAKFWKGLTCHFFATVFNDFPIQCSRSSRALKSFNIPNCVALKKAKISETWHSQGSFDIK